MVAHVLSMPAVAAASFSLVLAVASAGCTDGTTPHCSGAADMCGPVDIDSGPLPDAAADTSTGTDAGDMDAAPAVDAPPGTDAPADAPAG